MSLSVRAYPLAFLLCLLSAPHFAEAEEINKDLDALSITAPFIERRGDTTIVRRNLSPKKEDAPSTVGELLKKVGGVTVKEYGGLGGFSVATIRGSSAGQVAVYIDGIPIASGGSSVTNLQELPLSQVERVEVYKGFTPPGFAKAGIGGIINIITKKGGTDQFEVSSAYGSFETFEQSAMVSATTGKISVLGQGQYQKSRGNYSFKSDNGTPLNRSDDFTTKRRNNEYQSSSGIVKLWGRAGAMMVSANENYYRKSQGLPGVSSNQSKNAKYDTWRNILSVRLEPVAKKYKNLPIVKIYRVSQSTKFSDRDGEIGVGNQVSETVSNKNGFSVSESIDINRNSKVWLYADYSKENLEEHDLFTFRADDPAKNRNFLTLAASYEHEFFGFKVVPSLRYEKYEDSFGSAENSTHDFYSPKIGFIKDFGNGLKIDVNAALYQRAPDLLELFGDRGVVKGNADLLPEKGINLSGGFTYRDMRKRFSLSVFSTRSENLIAYIQNSQRTSLPVNIGKADVLGLETSFSYRFGSGYDLTAGYTFMRTFDRSDIPFYNGRRLPDRPEHDLRIRLDKKRINYSFYYEYFHTASTFTDRANFNEISARSIHNGGFTKNLPWKGFVMGVDLKNITDNKIEDAIGYPLPGRSVFLRITYKTTRR